MDPIEFYHQAARWFDAVPHDNSTVTARSIVSRAYYAALLVARDKAGIGTKTDTHKLTIAWYRKQAAPFVAIGNKLDSFRQMRVDADYDMSALCVRREAGEALKRSRDLLVRLGKQLGA